MYNRYGFIYYFLKTVGILFSVYSALFIPESRQKQRDDKRCIDLRFHGVCINKSAREEQTGNDRQKDRT